MVIVTASKTPPARPPHLIHVPGLIGGPTTLQCPCGWPVRQHPEFLAITPAHGIPPGLSSPSGLSAVSSASPVSLSPVLLPRGPGRSWVSHCWVSSWDLSVVLSSSIPRTHGKCKCLGSNEPTGASDARGVTHVPLWLAWLWPSLWEAWLSMPNLTFFSETWQPGQAAHAHFTAGVQCQGCSVCSATEAASRGKGGDGHSRVSVNHKSSRSRYTFI